MTALLNQLHEAIYNYDAQHNYYPTKIKLTTNFRNRLLAECTDEIIYIKDESLLGYKNSIFGIPFEIDNTIDGDYEFIYEEN